jgi:hypothetical protein
VRLALRSYRAGTAGIYTFDIYGHFQKPLNLKPEFGRRILEGAVRVNA